MSRFREGIRCKGRPEMSAFVPDGACCSASVAVGALHVKVLNRRTQPTTIAPCGSSCGEGAGRSGSRRRGSPRRPPQSAPKAPGRPCIILQHHESRYCGARLVRLPRLGLAAYPHQETVHRTGRRSIPRRVQRHETRHPMDVRFDEWFRRTASAPHMLPVIGLPFTQHEPKRETGGGP